jgi:hypothetical protein
MKRNMKPIVSYFLDLGFTKQELLNMIRRLPFLLGFNITIVLDPKYDTPCGFDEVFMG